MRQKAFTLLELIIAAVIVAILATLAIPTFARDIAGSSVQRDATSLTAAANDVRTIATSHGTPPSAAPSNADVHSGLAEVSIGGSPLTWTPASSATDVSLSYRNVSYDIDADNDKVGYAIQTSNGDCTMDLTTGNTTVSWSYEFSTAECGGYDALTGPTFVPSDAPAGSTSSGSADSSDTPNCAVTTNLSISSSGDVGGGIVQLAQVTAGAGVTIDSDTGNALSMTCTDITSPEVDFIEPYDGGYLYVTAIDADDWLGGNEPYTPFVASLTASLTSTYADSDTDPAALAYLEADWSSDQATLLAYEGDGSLGVNEWNDDGSALLYTNGEYVSGGSDTTSTTVPAPTTTTTTAPSTTQLICSPSFSPDNAAGISSDGTDAWVANWFGGTGGQGSVTEINESTDATTTINSSVFDGPSSIYSDGTDVWVADAYGGSYGNGSVAEINIATGVVTQINDASFNEPVAITASGPDVWVANFHGGSGNGSVSKIDIATDTVTEVDNASFNEIAAIWADGAGVFVANQVGAVGDAGSLTKIDVSSNAVTEIDSSLFAEPTALTSNGTSVWVANWNSGTVTETNVASGATTVLASATSLGEVYGLDYSDGSVWTASDNGSGDINRIDASTGAITTSVDPDSSESNGISADGAHVWVTNQAPLSCGSGTNSVAEIVQ
jgi:prepilin-type N-terminal cleavage/methylation domain-containing protein